MELVRIRNIQTGKVMAAIADSIEPYYSWKMTRSGYIKQRLPNRRKGNDKLKSKKKIFYSSTIDISRGFERS